MAIAYTYAINAARVVSQSGLTDVVREIDVTVTGQDGAARFDLPTKVLVGEPDPAHFTAFESLTEAQMISWIENDPALDPTKAHIALVVAKEVARLAMEQKPLPWVSTEPLLPEASNA